MINFIFKYFYQITRTLYPELEKSSSLHPQNKNIKKSRHGLLKYVGRLTREAQSRATGLTDIFYNNAITLTTTASAFGSSSYHSILSSKVLYNLASEVHAFLKVFIADGVRYSRGLFIFFGVDALIIDDEPLWEPIEWSMVQSWILFIFLFAWIAENLIVSRYGSYTGRDKRVWFSWYKSLQLINLWYVLTLGAAILFVITPFYYETNFIMSYTTLWWNWFTKAFFFQYLSTLGISVLILFIIQVNLRWFNWKKIFFLVLLIAFLFSYLLYTQFFMAFFSYFTNVNWYTSTRMTDYIQLSHEPNKWGWGAKKRDHFSYHNSKTVFWFKNDGPFAAAFMFIQFLFFISLFMTYLYWIVLLRRIYATQEFSYTYTTYAISALKQFFYFSLLLYVFIFMSYFVCYWRFPIEFIWLTNSYPWFSTFTSILKAYPYFVLSLIL